MRIAGVLILTLKKPPHELATSASSEPVSMPSPAETGPSTRLSLKQGRATIFLEPASIDYLEAAGNYVNVYTGEERYTVRETISSLEARLQMHDFVRIHRSVIVNRKHIRQLRPWPTGEYIVTLASGKELTLSRGFRDRLPLLRIA
jgi:two-component system LytT family response regulator